MPRPKRLRERNPKRLTLSQMVANERVRKAEIKNARWKRKKARMGGS